VFRGIVVESFSSYSGFKILHVVVSNGYYIASLNSVVENNHLSKNM
jgi:hypothetical protein